MRTRSSLLVRAVRLASLAIIAAPPSVYAGGFSLNEQSASAMGIANADAAANPENAITVLFNPAGMSQLSGTNISLGAAVLDILYEVSDHTQFGLSAQSGTEIDLKGDISVSNFPVLGPSGLTTTTLTEKVEVPLAIPESITFGARHRLTEGVTLLAGATYAKWSRFEELDVYSREGENGAVSAATGRSGDDPISHITEQWSNTWQFNVGGIWQATAAWAFKAGYAWDESPINGNYVTARIPSEDRHWLTLGTQWADRQSGWTVDAAVGTLIFAGDAKVNDRKYGHNDPAGEPTTAANYQGTYELSAWSAAIEVSKAF